MIRKNRLWAVAAVVLSSAAVPLGAAAQSSFYEGKTVSVVIGATGGSLELASSPDHGTTATLLLPAASEGLRG